MYKSIACLIVIGLILMVRPAFAEEGPQVKFEAGYPAQSSIQGLYDELDYQRAVQAYIWATPAVAGASFIEGAKRDLGASLNKIVIWESSANPQTVVFTGNSQSIYSIGIVDLEKYGPVVAELPPNVLGMVNNVWYYPLSDVGIAGPDQGKGGKYLILPRIRGREENISFFRQITQAKFLKDITPYSQIPTMLSGWFEGF